MNQKISAQTYKTKFENWLGQDTNTKPSKKERDKLNHLVSKSETTLYEIKTVFPFTLFPDTVTIEEDKVVITYRRFFSSQTIFPILFENLLSTNIMTTIFFGTLVFEIEGFETNPEPVRFLKKREAIQAHKIITGLTLSTKQGIDLSSFSKEEVLRKIKQIGTA